MGKVFRFDNDVDTDQIIASQYLLFPSVEEMAPHTFESLDADFAANVRPGDYVVAAENFGCGSSREHAPIAIKASGISLVIAKSFARIFYRNAINIGLAIVECPDAADALADGDTAEADLDAGIIRNLSTGAQFRTAPFPPFIQQIIAEGGLVNAIAKGIL